MMLRFNPDLVSGARVHKGIPFISKKQIAPVFLLYFFTLIGERDRTQKFERDHTKNIELNFPPPAI